MGFFFIRWIRRYWERLVHTATPTEDADAPFLAFGLRFLRWAVVVVVGFVLFGFGIENVDVECLPYRLYCTSSPRHPWMVGVGSSLYMYSGPLAAASVVRYFRWLYRRRLTELR